MTTMESTPFDQAVEKLLTLIKPPFGSGNAGGPRSTPAVMDGELEMATLTVVAQELVKVQPTKNWNDADRARGVVALGTFLTSVRAAEHPLTTYLMFAPKSLEALVDVLVELKNKGI